jgi:ABC-type Na+ efflux pump permease subunit
LKPEYVIAAKEFRAMMREKSFALVLIFEILLVSSSTFLASGYGVLTSPESSDLLKGQRNVIYAGLITNSKREFALPLMQSGIMYFPYVSLKQAEDDFQKGLIDTIIVGSVDLRKDPSVITVYMPSNTPKTGLIKLAMKRFFLNVEEKLRNVKMMVYTPNLRLLRYEDVADSGRSQTFEVFLIFTIPLLFIMPPIMAGSLMIDSLTEEMESKRILNLVVAPLKSSTIIAGKCLGAYAATLPHCVIWLIALSFTQYAPLNPAGILVSFTLYSILFIACGTIISLHFCRNRPSQMAYTLLAIGTITLMSPQANAYQLLIELSPAHILSGFALGNTLLDNWWQLAATAALTALSVVILWRRAGTLKVN